jgi:hypothetical protein
MVSKVQLLSCPFFWVFGFLGFVFCFLFFVFCLFIGQAVVACGVGCWYKHGGLSIFHRVGLVLINPSLLLN